MKLKDILALMYENEECQLVCIQDVNESIYFLGTVAELRRDRKPQAQDIVIKTMFTERYRSFGNQSGLTIVI